MTIAVGIGVLMSAAVGVLLGRITQPQTQTIPDLNTLGERMMHARNLGMRLNELAFNEQKLLKERTHLSDLLALKKEIEWLLDLVEERLNDDAINDHESLEDVMDAMGKTLRLVLDVGRRPQQPWSDLFPSLIHIHKSLCLVREIPAKNNHTNEIQKSDFQCNGVRLIEQLIQLHRLGEVHDKFPIIAAGNDVRFQVKPTETIAPTEED